MDQTPQQQATAPTPAAKKSQRTLWAIICLAGPTALFILTSILFAVSNYLYVGMATPYEGPTPDASITHTVINTVSFIIGAIATTTWLPGIVVGIVLLATKPVAPRQG